MTALLLNVSIVRDRLAINVEIGVASPDCQSQAEAAFARLLARDDPIF